MTKVALVSGLDADGLVMHPAGYCAFRLRNYANNQYYGERYFQPQYGEYPKVKLSKQAWQRRTVAAFIKFRDEMSQHLDFSVSEINNRLVYLLGIFEDQKRLNGAGSTVTGLLNRSGIRPESELLCQLR